MRILSLLNLLAVTAMMVLATPLRAADAFSLRAADGYRLNIADPHALRLRTEAQAVPEPQREPSPPSPLENKPYAELILEAAKATALDPALVHAVIFVESRYDPAARSPKGAIGLMQLLPETAARYGVPNPALSIEANIRAGTRYLQYLMRLFDNRLDLVLAAYNAGENAVLRYGHRIPPYQETQHYVPAVLAKYREWREPERPVEVTRPDRIEYIPGTRLDLGGRGKTQQ